MKNSALTLLLITLAWVATQAQVLESTQKRFKVDNIKGCAPFTITITDTNLKTTGQCTAGSPCLMDFEGNAQQQQNQFTHTYTTPGTYKLSVLYQSIGADDITITVVENTPPSFEIYSCSGNQVSIKITDNKYAQYATNFNDGSGETKQPFQNNMTAQHAYAASGNRTISVRGINLESADNCTANTQPFTARAALPVPSITALTATDASSLKMDFPKQTNMQLRSEIAVNNAATFQQYQNLYDLTTTNATSLRVDDNYYCFRLNNHDPCTNGNNYSPIICSQNFDLSIASGANNLAWTTAVTGTTSVTVKRNQQNNYTTIPGAPLTFSDTDVTCKTNYCYTITSNYPGGSKSTSLEKCGEAFTTVAPPQLTNVSAVVGNPQGVEISWAAPAAINTPEYKVYRSTGGASYLPLITTKDLKIQDGSYTTEGVYCYRVDYTDACGNASPEGKPACPIRLSGTLGEKNIADLLWSAYDGWTNGVNRYVVEKYTTDGQLIAAADLSTAEAYKDDPADPKNQVIRYIVKAYSNDTGVTLSSSNTIEIAKATNLFSPTAFTPNGDKLNDTFVVSGQYITKLELKVFDRWGVMVFSTDKNEPWNGTRSGSNVQLPTGTYIWKAEMTDFAGQTFSEEGTVMLIRKTN